MPSIIKKVTGSDSFFLLLAGLTVSVLVTILYIFQPTILQFVDYKIYDQFMRSSPVGKKTDIPVIVDIDDESLAELGQWPWPRYRMALLFAKIQQAGALSTGLDILIGEPDRTSPATIKKSLREELGVTVNFKGLPQRLMDNDLVLADVIQRGRFVLGFYFDFLEDKKDPTVTDQPCFAKQTASHRSNQS